jgi:hypothetical protein
MEALDAVLAVLFGSWLLISALAQVEVVVPRLRTIRRFDLFSVVPQYNFFAPVPGTKDFHLLVRSTTQNGEFSRWLELTSVPGRRWWNCLWNPDRRVRKALFDHATTLARESQACSLTALQISIPYLVLLNHATAVIAPLGASQVQFLIAMSSGTCSTEDARPLFLSQVHQVR